MAASSKKPASLRSQTNKEDDSNKHDDILHAIESMESRISNNIKSLEETIADKVTAAVREKMEIIRQEFKEDIVELYSRVTNLEAIVKDHPLLDPQLSSEVGDFNARLKVLEDAAAAAPGSSAPGVRSDLELNVVIRNLPHIVNEVTLNSVICLIKDGLKIKDVECVSAERKQSRNDKPGVIIAKFSCHEHKKSVMSKKATLQKHPVYKKVYINHDIAHEQGAIESSFHAILKEIGTDKLAVRGGRVVPTTRPPHSNTRAGEAAQS